MKANHLHEKFCLDRVFFNVDLKLNKSDKRLWALLATTMVDNCYITCKYKESNDRGTRKEENVTYTPIKYYQVVEIKVPVGKRFETYLITTSSRTPRLRSITYTFMNKSKDISQESYEFVKLKYLLEELKGSMDLFTEKFIGLAIDCIEKGVDINETPKCVNAVIKKMKLKQELERTI